jgi:hypothetical protein
MIDIEQLTDLEPAALQVKYRKIKLDGTEHQGGVHIGRTHPNDPSQDAWNILRSQSLTACTFITRNS